MVGVFFSGERRRRNTAFTLLDWEYPVGREGEVGWPLPGWPKPWKPGRRKGAIGPSRSRYLPLILAQYGH